MYARRRLETRIGRDGTPATPPGTRDEKRDFVGSGDPDERSLRNQDLPGNYNRYSAQPLPITPTTPLSRMPCAGSGPLNLDLQNRAYRDCSRPDMSNIEALPWITRANAKTALAALDATKPQVMPGPARSRLPAWIATGVTGALAVGLVVSYVGYDKYSSRTSSNVLATEPSDIRAEDQKREIQTLATWRHRMFGFAAAAVVSGAVTAFMWGRAQTRESFSVQPTAKGTGATVSWGRSF
jgi:hypothetical protein